ncbi:sugar isomerase domain-containing protein [Knoellia sp. CPCC 206453]|uniref:sugar isomerase domain-containing protein n=1 Tax=Knoellia pratensis TaxID=3404796 RepID=UPI00360C2BAC
MSELEYANVARSVVDDVITSQMEAVLAAAQLMAASIRDGGVVQAYGTGHSRIVALELAARAGGLASVGMLSVKDLVMFGGVDPTSILDPTYEREPGLAARIYELARPQPTDLFVIASNSGINAAIVEMASLVKANGHPLVAITSMSHTRGVASRDDSGRRLADLADVGIDNRAPRGDATIQLDGGQRIGAVSSLTGVLIAQLLTEATCRALEEISAPVPVYLSANTPLGDAHNASLYSMYGARIRPIEP